MSGSGRLLIVGASTRAAAISARRAGWTATCLDGFGDRDLAAASCILATAADRRDAFERVVADRPGIPWLYTGPIENDPDLVERLAARATLLGNPASVLRPVRDPIRLAALLSRAGLAHAEVRRDAAGLPRDGSWLIKPTASGGGRGIQPLAATPPALDEPCYFQRFVEGQSRSALFLAGRDGTRLLGMTRQHHGGPAGRFAYQGSIGPITGSTGENHRLARLGTVLSEGFGLSGLFGVDYILRDEEPWLVEINPRYTASVEVLELALGRSLLLDHLQAFGFADGPLTQGRAARRVVGKEVLYADGDMLAPEISFSAYSDDNPFLVPELADIPWPRTRIARGEPIMTVLAEGPDEPTCLASLEERAASWSAFLAGRGNRPPGAAAAQG